MPDIGLSELLVIFVVALLVLGPDKLPEAMKDLARLIRKIKAWWNDTTYDIRREIEMEELKDELSKYKEEMKKLQDETKVDNPLNSRDMSDILK